MNVSVMNARMLPTRLVVALAACLALAAAPAPTRIEGNHVHVLAPAGWKPVPAIADGMKKSLSGRPGIGGDAVAWGDTRAGVTGLLLWIDVTEPMNGRVRDLEDAFLHGMLKSMPRAGENERREETATNILLRGSSKNDESDLTTLATAVIDQQGRMHGYMMTCVRTGDAAARAKTAPACDAFLASFALTWKAAELKPLEKK
jgi:hypothetical protein